MRESNRGFWGENPIKEIETELRRKRKETGEGENRKREMEDNQTSNEQRVIETGREGGIKEQGNKERGSSYDRISELGEIGL